MLDLFSFTINASFTTVVVLASHKVKHIPLLASLLFTEVHLTLLLSVIKGMLGTDDAKASKHMNKCGVFVKAVSLYCCFSREGSGSYLLLCAAAL